MRLVKIWEAPGSSINFDAPKSATLATIPSERRMLFVFTSQCTIGRALPPCKCANPTRKKWIDNTISYRMHQDLKSFPNHFTIGRVNILFLLLLGIPLVMRPFLEGLLRGINNKHSY
jgi:hypothetical protein